MHDRLIQSVALVLLAAGLLGAFLMTPSINRERVERQITYDIEVGDSANPAYAFGEALGSFRGILVNITWQRAEDLKQKGKFHEANQLAEFITTLQPRYPEAWNFHGWNMAYNISVKCKTKEERWDWVQKGMALIRDRGIPNNPNGVVLYRSLGWILGHKMAGQTDDFHWYYKERWIDTWQTILGPPDPDRRLKAEYRGENAPTQEEFDPLVHTEWRATEQMRAVERMADTYLRRPGRPDDDYNASNYFENLSADARARFFQAYPDLEPVVRELEALTGPGGEELGLGLNGKTLRALGRVMLYRDAGYPIDNPAVISSETVGIEGVAVKAWLYQQELADPTAQRIIIDRPFIDVDRVRERFPDVEVINLVPLLDLLRAQTLIADYHMDPAYMVACMERFGPIDWRHPSAHSVYWTALGTLRAKRWTQDKGRVDFINANRATIHALQDLARYGKIAYRPEVEALGPFGESRIHYAADTRMIPAYERAVVQTREMFERGDFGETHNLDTYNRGHENFLQAAVVLYYFDGDEANARKYFQMAQDEYGQDPDSVVAGDGDYNLRLADFVRARMEDELGFQAIEMIQFWIREAFRRGIASRNPNEMRRYFDQGKAAYDSFLKERQTERKNDADVQGRQNLPPFGDLVLFYFLDAMADPGFTLPQKSSIWREGAQLVAIAEADMKPEERRPLLFLSYWQIQPPLNQQAQAAGWADGWQVLFPEPRGYREWYELNQQQLQPPSPVRPGG